MNSNEEYLDSLLKAVTGGQGLDISAETAAKKPENDIESEFILDAPEWDDEDVSLDADRLDFGDTTENEPMEGGLENEAEATEEAALLDPGALFFEGEEETEDDLFLNDMAGELPPIEEEAKDIEDILFTEEEPGAENLNEDIADAGDEGNEPDNDGIEDSPVFITDDMTEDIPQQDSGDEDIADLENLADLDTGESAGGDEEELEDLILAADSTEEVMEELPEFGNDEEGFQEISDLLANAGDSDEEMLAMLGGVGEEEGAADIGFFDEELEENKSEEIEEVPEEETKGKKKKAKKGKKGKKADAGEAGTPEENETGSEESPKKKGAFSRFMDFLLEEDEEETEAVKEDEANIDELLMGEAADENAAILAELDKEKEDKKSGKKEKKKKDKKGKKGKAKEAAEDGEDEEEDSTEEKSKKAKKEKKKKEKKEKPEEEPEVPGKRLSAKKIQATALMCLTIAAAIILVVQLIPPTIEKGKARDAFYAKDYEQVVEGFYGEKLSESDELMYNRALTILKFQRKIDAYNSYMYMGKETEALNQLIEAINRYDEIYDEAVAYNVIGEIDTLYQTVLDALQNRYGLSISRAMEIYAIEDDFEYTLMLESIISGIEYSVPDTSEQPAEGQLPEGETEMPAEQPEGEAEMPAEQLPEGEVPAE